MFNWNTEEAFSFYKSAFGGELATLVRFKDMPSDPNNQSATHVNQQPPDR